MEYSILDRLSKSPEIQEQIQKEKRAFRAYLDKQYNYEKLSFFNLTKRQAILINLGYKPEIDRAYFGNMDYIAAAARWYQNNKTQGARIYCAEDIIQQVYVDLRYYDFTSDITARRCLYRSCATSNNGGILNYRTWASERRAKYFLFDQIKAHNSKMEDSTNLFELIADDEKKTNPETLIIDREEPAKYTKVMQQELLKLLPRSQRVSFLKAFGGADDE